ncbi:aminoglycoside phosphotransferase family protein [Brachybacterium phenoliresistens]|uniref:Kinase n=1 Tax=Brachybacterium phenoliresistens TaxID=396014 RepID=Z9JRL0_9MICO|nr:aminoglycoside phosphotransferase family protein [Brachybacterium phenoliresistens]EWS80839.1 kinase [Brachybacterium phenoliresistens]
MTGSPDIPAAVRHRLVSQDRAAAAWLDGLPSRIGAVLERWDLRVAGPPSFGGTSVVLPVRSGGTGSAALKLVSPLGDAVQEARALEVLAGHGTVRRERHSPEDQALLLELLPGPTLADLADEREAVAAAGAVAARIAAVPAPPDAPQLAASAPAWREAFARQHRRAIREGRALPADVVQAADATIGDLAGAAAPGMTHGDLSFANVLRRDDGAWVAIDPLYRSGPAEHEAHTVLRSVTRPPLSEGLSRARGMRRMRELLGIFCEAASLDPQRAWRISQARFAASAFWEAEHGGDAADIAWLREMAAEIEL